MYALAIRPVPRKKIVGYMMRNGIGFKRLSEVSHRHRIINGIQNDAEFWMQYYESNMDKFGESVDYRLNKRVFGPISNMLGAGARVFEPCCRSGYFGVWLASSRRDITYAGMDINPVAIAKAKRLASQNGVDQSCFAEGDYFSHGGKYDTVVGRGITNMGDFNMDTAAMKRICSLADEVIELHFTYEHKFGITAMGLESFYGILGFGFRQVSRPFATMTGSGSAVAFVYRAARKP